MNAYKQLKQKHQEEVNNFPMAFAFTNSTFELAMAKLGLTVTDKDKVCSIGAGGFIRKTDREAFENMFKRHDNEICEAVENDLTGEGFIFDMFDYELSNHEYSYTGDATPALHAIGLNWDDIHADEKLKHGLNKAKKEQMEYA